MVAVLCVGGSRGSSADNTNDAPGTQPAWVAPHAAKSVRQVGDIPLVMRGSRDAIVLGTTSCPVALFGQKFWDLSKHRGSPVYPARFLQVYQPV